MAQTTAAERVGATVRAEMARRRFSQEVVAERLGISQTALSRRLRGAVAFDVNELEQIALLMDLPATAFLDDPQARLTA